MSYARPLVTDPQIAHHREFSWTRTCFCPARDRERELQVAHPVHPPFRQDEEVPRAEHDLTDQMGASLEHGVVLGVRLCRLLAANWNAARCVFDHVVRFGGKKYKELLTKRTEDEVVLGVGMEASGTASGSDESAVDDQGAL